MAERRRRASRPAVHPDVDTVLFDATTLARRVQELGVAISADYAGGEIVVLGVLRGALVFMADLLRAIEGPVTIDFLSAASYGAATESSGTVRIEQTPTEPLVGRDVLVVDTVLDTGLTLRVLDAWLRAQGPTRVRYCVLLEKDRGGPPGFRAEYVGFTIPDRFVVGYGCDYAQRYRNLPYVGVLRPSVYARGDATSQIIGGPETV